MGRGRGKGKRGGRGGGGRQHFVSSLEELESRNDRDEAWAARRKAERESDDSDSEGEEKKGGSDEESGSEEGSGDEGTGGGSGPAAGAGGEAGGGAEKKVKSKGVASLIEVENPNAKPKGNKMMKAKVGHTDTHTRRC